MSFTNINATEYQERTLGILRAMLLSDPDLRVAAPLRMPGVESYENIVVVTTPPKVPPAYFLESTFGVTNYKENAGQHSFSLEGNLVDWIIVSQNQVAYAQTHHSYDGLGPILGRLAFAMGLKSNSKGLQYCIRESLFDGNISDRLGHVLDTVHLSDQFSDLMELLGLNPMAFYKGFRSMEEAFLWLIQSHVFTPALFEKFTNVMASQNDPRYLATYHKFDQWLKSHPDLPNNQIKNRMDYLRSAILPRYGHIEPRIYACNARFLRKREVQRRINPEKVRDWLGLDRTVDVRNDVNRFKEQWKELDLMSKSDEELKQSFLAHYYAT